MTNKQILQLVSRDGKAVAPATSSPDCFIHDNTPINPKKDPSWGKPFSVPSPGNKVEFYVTGEKYFNAVARAIAGAKKSIYITGWQVNFDVDLAGGKTLFEHLAKAIDTNPALHVYVMPWLSPQAGVATGDFDTLVALAQLNAGISGPARAFVLPAIAQSDMQAGLAIWFSHHQKLVVVDDEQAFVGGIDLAYGRRDDGECSVDPKGRTGNEHYNPCIPAMHELSNVELSRYLSRLELLKACAGAILPEQSEWQASASRTSSAMTMDGVTSAAKFVGDKQRQVADRFANTTLLTEFIDVVKQFARENPTIQELDKQLNTKLSALRETGTAHAVNVGTALVAWLNNASMDQLSPDLRKDTERAIQSFIFIVLGIVNGLPDWRRTRYPNLLKLRKIAPMGGVERTAVQPRMPWHDVHSSIKGPAVADLSRNFVQRWNGVAHRYERSYSSLIKEDELPALFRALGMVVRWGLKLPRLPLPTPAKSRPKIGTEWVQVHRSAPKAMLKDEAEAHPGDAAARAAVNHVQNNCLKAMLRAIKSSQQFIYIEGQFFQTAYGEDVFDQEQDAPAGPTDVMTDIMTIPGIRTYAKSMGLEGLLPGQYPKKINWKPVEDGKKSQKIPNNVLVRDLKAVLANLATIEATQLMGPVQGTMLNPIGEALAERVASAIYDDRPFHIYMVVPVHPEGTLNTLNIMSQVHLTMQSLVFGTESLINRIRRAVLAKRVSEIQKIGILKAEALVRKYPLDKVVEQARDEWKKYLTLLNLRNWGVLGERPVTEQIYVHSKLLIADDRVAVLGSANINDRSQLGGRDSELAVTIRDNTSMLVKLDGVRESGVSASVHKLRIDLWNKLFGLDGGKHQADELRTVVARPAAKATWEAIQKVAYANAVAYQNAFQYVPRVSGKASSIWPTWNKVRSKLDSHMPFDERFWRAAERQEEPLSWHASSRGIERAPVGVKGYIVALPTTWTLGENNFTGFSRTIVAGVNSSDNKYEAMAYEEGSEQEDERQVV